MPDPTTAPSIEQYIDALLPPRDPLLARVEVHAREHRLPIVGPAEGGFLAVLARLHQPRRILELGCCTGYSALWLAQATEATGATVETVELDPQRADVAEANFRASPYAERITLYRGNALDLLPTLPDGTYDLVFNDLLRSGAGERDGVPNQLRFLQHALRVLRPGGLLLSDNVLCGGQVADPAPTGTGAAIAEYNRRLFSHPDLTTALVPVRDGVAISIVAGG
jgi:predicted O-methyltransferase YrrM